jgi:hypothetical protein
MFGEVNNDLNTVLRKQFMVRKEQRELSCRFKRIPCFNSFVSTFLEHVLSGSGGETFQSESRSASKFFRSFDFLSKIASFRSSTDSANRQSPMTHINNYLIFSPNLAKPILLPNSLVRNHSYPHQYVHTIELPRLILIHTSIHIKLYSEIKDARLASLNAMQEQHHSPLILPSCETLVTANMC